MRFRFSLLVLALLALAGCARAPSAPVVVTPRATTAVLYCAEPLPDATSRPPHCARFAWQPAAGGVHLAPSFGKVDVSPNAPQKLGAQLIINGGHASSATPLAGDVGGTLGANTVNKISGATPILITPSVLQWTAATAAPTLTQAALASTSGGSGAAGQPLAVTAQAGQAATDGSNNGGAGGALTLSSGAGGTSGSATKGAPGAINISTSGTSGTDASAINFQNGSTTYLALTENAGATTTQVALPSGITNLVFNASNGSQTIQLISPTGNLTVGSTLSSTIGTFAWTAAVTAATITEASLSSQTQGNNLTITPQQSTQATNFGGGNLVVALQTPGGSGTEAFLKTERGATANTALGAYPASSTSGALYLGSTAATTPSTTNWAMFNDNANTYLSAPSGGALHFYVANTTYLANWTATSIQWEIGAVQWDNNVTPTLGQIALASTSSGNGAAGQTMTHSAQSGEAATGAGNNGGAGGNLTLSGGAGGTSGSATAGIGGFIGLASGQTIKTTSISASTYTVDTNSTTSDFLILTDSTSNAITVTLPTPTAGRYLCFKDRTGEAATHNVTISHHSAETIDGASTIVQAKNYDCTCLTSNGTNWSVVSEFSSSIVP